MATQINLSNVSVDFEALLSELETDLSKRQTWKDLIVSGTGTTILEYIASIGVFNQFNIEMSLREAFLTWAVRDSSRYGIARMLGVRISRKNSAVLAVSLTNSGNTTIYITKNSTFTASSTSFFNVNQINIAPGQNPVVALQTGIRKRQILTVSNLNFFEYILQEPGFVVSDTDLTVTIRDIVSGSEELWTRTESALWMHTPTDKVYFESTLEDGDVSILFGDGQFGAIPPITSQIIIDYVLVQGEVDNSNLIGGTIQYSNSANVTGQITEYWSDGANPKLYATDQKPSDYYKVYAPHIFKARGIANTPTDYVSVIMSYPNVADVTVFAQRDLYPNDPMWMNTVRICVLTLGANDNFGGVNPNPRTQKWVDFINWLQPKCGALIVLQTWNPKSTEVDVVVNVAMLAASKASDIQPLVEARIRKLFEKNSSSLGESIYLSDIERACSVEGVDYVDIKSPLDHIIINDRTMYAALRSLTVNLSYSERTSLPMYRR